MKISFLFIIWYFLFISNSITNAYCPNDEDLQHHKCTCNLINNSIQCSSLPNQCHTCYLYKEIYFDDKVHILPKEAFYFYNFFNNNTKNKFFKIQFTQLNILLSNSFSKLIIPENKIFEIKILKYTSSIIPIKLFQNINIQSKAKINIEIINITSNILTIEQYAFNGIIFNYKSQFRLSIFYAKNIIQFKSNSGSILLPSYSIMELYFSNFIQIILDEFSFNNIIQEYSSELKLNFNYFQYITFSHKSFMNFHQFDQSYFYLLLFNFQNLFIKQTLFDKIIQLKSSIISINNLTNNLCLSKKIFNEIKQNNNSRLELEINSVRNILFTSNSFININQTLQSKLFINIINSFDIYFSSYSFNNIYQENSSLIDISIKYGQNLIFDDYVFNNIYIYHSSIFKIAFQHSRGTLQMAINTFTNINQDKNSELLFQIMNSSDFYFRFNQSTSLKHIEIIDQSLTSNDLCRIANIPSHIPVKLSYNNQCSCTIYYLYRYLHHQFLPSILKHLIPSCYLNMSFKQLEYVENECLFKDKISNCQQMEGEIQINIPQEICQENLKFNLNQSKKNSLGIFIFIIFSCLIFSLICIYILLLNNRRLSWNCLRKYFNHHSQYHLYEHMTKVNQQKSMKKILVKYNSITEQIQPYLDDNNEDIILKLNTNSISDIQNNIL